MINVINILRLKLDIIFLKKIWIKFKNALDIVKSKINKSSKCKIFLNKTQFNRLLEQGFIKYKLTDSKKRMNIQKRDGIASLIKMALPFVKSIAPKVLGTIGLSGLSTGVSHVINKALNKKDYRN